MLNTIKLSKCVFICVLGVTLSVVLFGLNRVEAQGATAAISGTATDSSGGDRSHFGHRDR